MSLISPTNRRLSLAACRARTAAGTGCRGVECFDGGDRQYVPMLHVEY